MSKDTLNAGQQALIEAEALVGKCDETRSRIRSAAGDMMGRYEKAIASARDEIRTRGVGSAPDAEDRLRRLLNSRHLCARVSSESKARG